MVTLNIHFTVKCEFDNVWRSRPTAVLFCSVVSSAEKKKLVKRCLNFANLLCKAYSINEWSSYQQFDPSYENTISAWCLEALRSGASYKLSHSMYVDLSIGEEEV